jgi:hypothetical protein
LIKKPGKFHRFAVSGRNFLLNSRVKSEGFEEMLPGSMTISGFLHKKGPTAKHAWKLRFFTLQGQFLRYFKKENDPIDKARTEVNWLRSDGCRWLSFEKRKEKKKKKKKKKNCLQVSAQFSHPQKRSLDACS